MSDAALCPNVDDLQQFALGRLAETDAQRVQQHLAGCTKCLEVLHRLEAQDTLINAMQAQGQANARPEDAIVEGLVAHLKGLQPPGEGDLDATVDSSLRERADVQIGPYKLLQEIGAGGMGVVWMVEQSEPVQRKVALKIIKPGMDSRQIVARFEAERQALALMDHPNIAKVFDGGTTTSGRPYFVMELVKGRPITAYCDEHRLTPRQRLELFLPVCQAIQHAHQKGIIHRDIKPSNVLVAPYDGSPVPKVIDFGVAKATGQRLTEKTLFTEFGAVVGTVEYMSPEQAELNNQDIDTRSDIYSLGVLLYELLAGSPPFTKQELEKAGLMEMLRVIREQEPSKPSTKLSSSDALPSLSANRGTEPARLTRLLRGELDWIVMKALEKDRNRRYETANGFALDLQRYLADEPVQACPPSVGYRFRKFARRNKAALTTASVVVLAVMLLVGSIGWMLRDRAAREQEIARDQAERQTATDQEANLAIKEAEGLLRHGTYAEALSAAKRAEGILAGGGSDELRERGRELQKDLQMALRLDGIRVTGDDVAGSIERDGQYAQAFLEYGIDVESLDIQQVAEQVAARSIRLELIVALDNWANERKAISNSNWKRLIAVARAADPDEWRNQVRDALEQGKMEVLTELAASPKISTLPMQTLDLLGTALHHMGDEQDVPFLRAVQGKHPGDFSINFKLAWALEHRQHQELDEAIRFYTAALVLRPQNVAVHVHLARVLKASGRIEEWIACERRVVELDPKDAGRHSNLGTILNQNKRPDEAIACYRKAIELDPTNATCYHVLGHILRDVKRDLDEAIACFRKASELNPKNVHIQFSLYSALCDQKKFDEAALCWKNLIELDANDASYLSFGRKLFDQKKFDEAIACFRRAIEIDPKNVVALEWLGFALQEQNNFDEAIACLRKAVELGSNHASVRFHLGVALGNQGKLDEAVAAYRKAIELDPNLAAAHNNLGAALGDQKKFDEAIACYQKAIELLPKNAIIHANLGVALEHQGKLDEAIACFRKTIEIEPGNAMAHNKLGLLWKDQKKFDEAIACFRKAIEIDPKDAVYHIHLGDALDRQGKPDQALACLRKAIEIDPKCAPAHNNLGVLLDRQMKPGEAIACYKKAIEVDPTFAAAHVSLALSLYQQKKLDEAITSLKKAIEIDPRYAFAHQNLGAIMHERGKLDEAIACFLKAIESDPREADAHGRLSRALYEQGKVDEAIACVRKAIELDPEDPLHHTALGECLAKKGALDEAVACHKKAIAIDPKTALFHNNLGSALHAQKKFDEALACYQEAIALDPRNPVPHTNLGRALHDQQKFDEAAACYQKAIEINPKFVPAHSHFGRTLRAQGKLDEAVACFQRGIELDPKSAVLQYRLLSTLCDQKKFDEAALSWKKFIELDPNNASTYLSVGSELLDRKDFDQAIDFYTRAVEIDRERFTLQCAAGLANVGFALIGQKKYEQAITCTEKALDLDPKNPGANNSLAWLLATAPDPKLRDARRAVALAKKAVDLEPMAGNSWNTLGVALYRTGNWKDAITALDKSMVLSGGEWECVNTFFLAMAHWQLGEKEKAGEWYDRAVQWMAKNQPDNEELRRFRAEAKELLEIAK